MLEKILSGLDLSPDEVRIYSRILETGSATAGELAKKIGMARPTLYGILQKLTDKGVITRTLRYGVRSFAAVPPEKLDQLFQQRIEHLQSQRRAYKEILPDLLNKGGFGMHNPRFQLYEGAEGVQHVLKDMLLYYDTDTFAFWPIKSMVEILSPEFFRYHNKERIRNNLYTRAIWPEKEVVTIKEHPYLGVGEAFRREIRVAPTEIHCTMGYWAYGDRVAFLSSQRESFGFVLESRELVTMLKAKFDVIWNISKRLDARKEDMAPFIKDLEQP